MRRLDTLLRRMVTLVMAAPAGLVACSGDDVGIENDPGFVRPSCEDPYGDLVRGLKPQPPVDFLELHLTQNLGTGSPNFSVGQPCSNASDMVACSKSVAFLEAQPVTNMVVPEMGNFFLEQCVQRCELGILITTRGDDVIALDTPAGVRSLLGSIDTPQEAEFLVRMNGFSIPCDRGGAKPSGNGFDVQAFSRQGCDGVTRHVFHVTADGMVAEASAVVEKEANPNCQVGRRPAGLRPSRRSLPTTPIASYLSNAARLEAASVDAFHRLARELQSHGAPQRLVKGARRAARDEVRHAKVTFQLARSFGATKPVPLDIEPIELRDLDAVAIENAIEGCVRETFGAAVGIWQARRARSEAVRSAMRRIAVDETRHAALAWEVDRWCERRMGTDARRRVHAARAQAISALQAELRHHPTADVIETLGVPSPVDAIRLHAALVGSLWS